MPDTGRSQLVIREIERLQFGEIISHKWRDWLDIVVLKIDVNKRLQISQLLDPHLVVGQVYRVQVLEVAEIFLNDLNYSLGGKLRLNGFMWELYSAGIEDQESVKQLANRFLRSLGMQWLLCWISVRVLGFPILKTFLGVDWIYDSINSSWFQWVSLLNLLCPTSLLLVLILPMSHDHGLESSKLPNESIDSYPWLLTLVITGIA